MIDLAPNHKLGLIVDNPILLAGGSIGYGEAIHAGLDLSKLGGAVVGPVLLKSRAGAPPARLHEFDGGVTIATGLQNRGLDATLRTHSRLWPRLGCPVIVQVADDNPRSLARVVQKLDIIEGVVGFELLLPNEIDTYALRTLIRMVVDSCDLPLWVKLPIARAVELAPVCVHYEAVGLVVGTANSRSVVSGSVVSMSENSDSLNTDSLNTAYTYGPFVFPHMLSVLGQIATLRLDCALIACGGIHNVEQVKQVLAAGARAVQIDSALWVEPGLPGRLVDAICV